MNASHTPRVAVVPRSYNESTARVRQFPVPLDSAQEKDLTHNAMW